MDNMTDWQDKYRFLIVVIEMSYFVREMKNAKHIKVIPSGVDYLFHRIGGGSPYADHFVNDFWQWPLVTHK